MKSAQPKECPSAIRFQAKLIRSKSCDTSEMTGGLAILTFPKNAGAKLLSGDMTVVEGTINGFPFRASLESKAEGIHWLEVGKGMRDAAGAEVGDTVTVEITRVGQEPEIRVPTDLRQRLATAPRAQALWAEITPMARRDWILWISSAKQEETRRSRIEKACSMLGSGKRRVCCFGGLNWLTKDYPNLDSWLPLTNAKADRLFPSLKG